MDGWVEQELATLDLQDERRNRRLKRVVADLAARPAMSIPAAVGGGHAETAAAYRLFDNPAMEFESVLAPHREATLARVQAQAVVVVAQDTTEIDLTRPHEPPRGAGPLDAGPRRGCFLHPLLAVTPERVPLGTVWTRCWARDEPPPERLSPAARKRRRARTPIEDKESQRWIDGLRAAHEIAALAPQTEVISVADSEADIFELLLAGQAEAAAENHPRAQWILRAGHDRAVRPEEKGAVPRDGTESTEKHVFAAVAATSVLTTAEITIRGRDPQAWSDRSRRRQPRTPRQAVVEIRARRVTLRAPSRPDRRLNDVTVQAVLVREVAPPAGEDAVTWLLLTSLPIETVAQVQRVIEFYCLRWVIELFFRVLKQGCRVEARRFECLDRWTRYLSVAMIVAWRTLYVTYLGRGWPDRDCEVVFTPAEWKSVYQVTQRRPPPEKPPSLQEMVRLVAQLGGYVNRKRKDEPGAETVWKGLQRLHDITLCWETFGPEARSG